MTQKERVLNYLKGGNTLTSLEAIHRFGITRLPDRVRDLHLDGHQIHSQMVDVVNRFGDKCRVAKYTLIKEESK